MPDTPAFPVQVFYDGSCSLCAAEMEKYRAMEHGGRLLFVNISAPRFDPAPHGITLDEFMHEMHCIDRNGRVFRGVEGFRVIWLAFPTSSRYAFLAFLVSFPGLNLLARLVYWSLARLRRTMPQSSTVGRDGRNRPGGCCRRS